MKTSTHILLAFITLFSTSFLFAFEPDDPIKKNISECTSCKGEVFLINSIGLRSIRLFDEHDNLIDVNNEFSAAIVHYSFDDAGTYRMELVDKDGAIDNKMLIIP